MIEKLVRDGFVKREKAVRREGTAFRLLPTEDGVKLITVLPDVVKSPKLTADWENALTLVSKGEYSMQEFMGGIEDMVKELVQTYYCVSEEQKTMFGSSKQETKRMECVGKCPKCGGQVVKGKFGAYCKNKCGMNVSRVMGTVLTDAQVKDMLAGKKILLKGLRNKANKAYDAMLFRAERKNTTIPKTGKKKAVYNIRLL